MLNDNQKRCFIQMILRKNTIVTIGKGDTQLAISNKTHQRIFLEPRSARVFEEKKRASFFTISQT